MFAPKLQEQPNFLEINNDINGFAYPLKLPKKEQENC
jgi:hypothetical protein